jgi:hypothetical protein
LSQFRLEFEQSSRSYAQEWDFGKQESKELRALTPKAEVVPHGTIGSAAQALFHVELRRDSGIAHL